MAVIYSRAASNGNGGGRIDAITSPVGIVGDIHHFDDSLKNRFEFQIIEWLCFKRGFLYGLGG